MSQPAMTQIIFAEDEQSTLPSNIQALVQAFEACEYIKNSIAKLDSMDTDFMQTFGDKEQIQDALNVSNSTLSKALDYCSEQDIEKADIAIAMKKELKLQKRRRELELIRPQQQMELER